MLSIVSIDALMSLGRRAGSEFSNASSRSGGALFRNFADALAALRSGANSYLISTPDLDRLRPIHINAALGCVGNHRIADRKIIAVPQFNAISRAGADATIFDDLVLHRCQDKAGAVWIGRHAVWGASLQRPDRYHSRACDGGRAERPQKS